MHTIILILFAIIGIVSSGTIFITVVPYKRWYRQIKDRITGKIRFIEHRIVKATKYYYPHI